MDVLHLVVVVDIDIGKDMLCIAAQLVVQLHRFVVVAVASFDIVASIVDSNIADSKDCCTMKE